MAGCLSNGTLRQQWECTSVGAVCLGNGGSPFPTKLHHPELHHPGFSCACSETLNTERFKSPFCLSLWGWDPPSLITWLPASEPSFFVVILSRMVDSPRCFSLLLIRHWDLCDFPCSDPPRWLKRLFPVISWSGSLSKSCLIRWIC